MGTGEGERRAHVVRTVVLVCASITDTLFLILCIHTFLFVYLFTYFYVYLYACIYIWGLSYFVFYTFLKYTFSVKVTKLLDDVNYELTLHT